MLALNEQLSLAFLGISVCVVIGLWFVITSVLLFESSHKQKTSEQMNKCLLKENLCWN